MQQKLAVASVLLLVTLAGASAVMIQVHALNQSTTHNVQQATTAHGEGTSTNGTNSTLTSPNGGSLLNSGPPSTSTGEGENETEIETEAAYSTNMTGDS